MLTLGNPKNPSLVFLHGFLGCGESWLEIARPLSENYFCILPDLPGHGENTNRDINSPLNFDVLTDWLSELLDEIPTPKIHLVGYSLGGRAALTFACRYPERILTLTLESANPGIVDESERTQRLAEDSARAESILKDGMSVFVERWYRMLLFASLNSHPKKLSAIKESASRNNPRWMAKVIRELSPGAQTPLWDSLPNLSFPVLLIAGGRMKSTRRSSQKWRSGFRTLNKPSFQRQGITSMREDLKSIFPSWINFYENKIPIQNSRLNTNAVCPVPASAALSGRPV